MLVRRAPGTVTLVFCLAAVLVTCGDVVARVAAATLSADVRGLWVTRATLTSPANVAQMVRAAAAAGFNTLLVQVRGRGDAYYRSSLEPRAAELAGRPDYDPLGDVLTLAHRAGLSVHAWLAVNLVSSAVELPAARQHLVYRQPEWLMVPRELAGEMLTIDPRSPEYVGRLARWTRARAAQVEGLYASPMHPSAVTHLAGLVTELATLYPLDGVHLDYVRYPNSAFDYSRTSLQQFKNAVRPRLSDSDRRRAEAQETLDPLAYPNLFADEWDAFRRSRLTALVMRLRTAAKAAAPGIAVSAAVVADLEQATEERLQDWRTWLDQDLIDAAVPMAYTDDHALFAAQIAEAQAVAAGDAVWAGVGAYRLSRQATVEHIAAAKRMKTAGVVLFSYDALVAPPNDLGTLSELARAAFGGGPSMRRR
jgi:uncharacterized lipoprotein YddW (UPF0748 family)